MSKGSIRITVEDPSYTGCALSEELNGHTMGSDLSPEGLSAERGEGVDTAQARSASRPGWPIPLVGLRPMDERWRQVHSLSRDLAERRRIEQPDCRTRAQAIGQRSEGHSGSD